MKTTISQTAAAVQPLPPQLDDERRHTPGELLDGPEHSPDDEPMHVLLLQRDGEGMAERHMAKVCYGRDIEQIRANAKRLAHCWNCHDELVQALQYAEELIRVARNHFPKSMRDSDKFQLENTCAAIGSALHKAKG